jgi:hypothetical protein
VIVRINRRVKKILLSMDVQKYGKLVNGIYSLPNPRFPLTIEREQGAVNEVRKLVKKYFPGVLKDYDVVLSIKEDEVWKDPIYSLTLRKKNRKVNEPINKYV